MSAPSTGINVSAAPAGQSATVDPLIGCKLGAYRLLGRLGEGGMGTVYTAEHEVIGRKAAIKLLNAQVSTDEEAVSRFFTEARAVNQIRHPNIVEVTDFGSADGRYFIVMEYLEGETLAGRLDRLGMLDAASTVNIGRQVASALGAAHERGMVHRDLKPGNIFLREHPDYPDFVKVLDFGIAKLLAPDSTVAHQTRVGSLIGTPSYMSPEQCLGDPNLDHRSDIYSLAVVLYGMLTGKLPFKDGPLGQVIMSHVTEIPRSPCELNPEVPVELAAALMKALAKKPEDRFASMRDMRNALEAAIGHQRVPTPAAGTALLGALSEAPGGNLAPATPSRVPVASRAPDSQPVKPRAFSLDTMAEPNRPALPAASGSISSRPVVRSELASPTATRILRPATPPSMGGASRDEALLERLLTIVGERISTGKLEIPALSPITQHCLEQLKAPGFGFAQIARAVAPNPALASRIVRLANSPAFPSLTPASSLQQAVGRLGEKGLQQALIEFEARPILEAGDERVREALRRPWYHALAAAMAAERLVQALRPGDEPMSIYLAALLHDVGKPIVARFLTAVERQTAGPRGPRWMSDDVWMRAVMGTFRQVTLAVVNNWQLPNGTVGAIQAADAIHEGDGRSDGNIVRFALATADQQGYFMRRQDVEPAEAIRVQGRLALKLDERTETRLLSGFGGRVSILAPVRGA